jgi:hypothetical protein
LAFLVALDLHLTANDSISFPTGPAAWTIKIADSPNNKSPSNPMGKISSIEVIQNQQFRHSLITYSNNQTKDFWSIVGTDLFLTEYSNGAIALNPTNKFFFVPFAPSSFDWVQPGLLQEKDPIDFQGTKCFHYKGSMGSSPSSGAPGLTSATIGGVPVTIIGEVWVDSKTLLPVAFDDGQILATFTFHPTPTTPLVPPAKYLDLYERYKIVNGLPKSS